MLLVLLARLILVFLAIAATLWIARDLVRVAWDQKKAIEHKTLKEGDSVELFDGSEGEVVEVQVYEDRTMYGVRRVGEVRRAYYTRDQLIKRIK